MNTRILPIFTVMAACALALSVGLLAASCGGSNDDDDASDGSEGNGDTAPFSLYMIDAPVEEADEINMTILAVSVNGPDGWVDLAITPKRYNLLELMNNAGVVLADQVLSVGAYSEVRLIIECEGAEAPEIIIDNESFQLTVPSGCSSGFKMKGEFSVAAGQETVLIMDFDMQKSIHETGNGEFILNPVVRFNEAEATGNINGEVSAGVPSVVTVYAFEADVFTGANFDDASNSTIARADGSFTLAALAPGAYDIVVATPIVEAAVYVEDVVVEAGSDTTLENSIDLGLDL